MEEALCFGWIDSTVRKVDEARFVQKFTPRRFASGWSALNIQRARRLIVQGKMTAAGQKVFNPEGQRPAPKQPTRLPKDLQSQFRKHSGAWANFQRFPPYYRRMTIGWVASAKREETRLKRLEKLLEFSARNERIQFM